MDKDSLLSFIDTSVYDGEFTCSSPHYYNDEFETACLPFLNDA